MRAIYQPRQRRTRAQRALSVVSYVGFVAAALAFVLTVRDAASAEWARATFSLLLCYLLLESSTILKERGDTQ